MQLAKLAPDTLTTLKQVSTATITMQLLKRGFRSGAINGVQPLSPMKERLVGEAYTLRYIPMREDLSQAPKAGEGVSPARRAIEEVPAGQVLVIDSHGNRSVGVLGDILAMRLKQRGVAGVVADGMMRDTEPMISVGLPVLCAGRAAPASMTGLIAADVQVPIGCGGTAVFPGDLIVADADGAVVVPRHLADQLARDGLEQERMERFVFRQVRNGQSTLGLYPPDEASREAYRRWVEAGEPE